MLPKSSTQHNAAAQQLLSKLIRSRPVMWLGDDHLAMTQSLHSANTHFALKNA